MNITLCPICSQTFDTAQEGRLPPWCPRCGADLKPRVESPKGTGKPLPDAITSVRPTPLSATPPVQVFPEHQLSYFQVRASKTLDASGTYYRVYVTEGHCYFMRLGFPRARRKSRGMPIGAMFGLAGLLIVSALSSSEVPRDEMAERTRILDLADEEALVLYIQEGDGSFRLTAAEIQRASLGPVSFWRKLVGNAPDALLKLTHREVGELSWELPTFQEVSKVRESLRPFLGDRFQDELRKTVQS